MWKVDIFAMVDSTVAIARTVSNATMDVDVDYEQPQGVQRRVLHVFTIWSDLGCK